MSVPSEQTFHFVFLNEGPVLFVINDGLCTHENAFGVKLSNEMRPATGGSFIPKPEGVIPENAWTHLAVVVDRKHAEVRYYFNGAPNRVVPIPSSFTGSLDVDGAAFSIGSTWHPFIGLIDEVRIYKRALPVAEIAADYAGEKAGRASTKYEIVE